MKAVLGTLQDILDRWPLGIVLVGAAYLGYYYANWEHHQELVGHEGMVLKMERLETRVLVLEHRMDITGP